MRTASGNCLDNAFLRGAEAQDTANDVLSHIRVRLLAQMVTAGSAESFGDCAVEQDFLTGPQVIPSLYVRPVRFTQAQSECRRREENP